jgi:rubrerythrin
MKTLLIKTHELWLEVLMAGFMSRTENRTKLYDFSGIIFRHFTWLEKHLITTGETYDYDRDTIPVKVERLSVILGNINRRITELDLQIISCPDAALAQRITSDLKYIKATLAKMPDEEIRAFDTSRTLDGIALTAEATDALTLFLFEESYKEYELILIYNYLQAHSSDAFLNHIFQIMIDESQFHLRSFGQMMAEMGILGVPRTIHKSLYQIADVKQFLKDGIEEEKAAKEMCRELSDAVIKDSPELADFFDFINYQEDYHISLMQDALTHYERLEIDG